MRLERLTSASLLLRVLAQWIFLLAELIAFPRLDCFSSSGMLRRTIDRNCMQHPNPAIPGWLVEVIVVIEARRSDYDQASH